jgi:hypothetical protein
VKGGGGREKTRHEFPTHEKIPLLLLLKARKKGGGRIYDSCGSLRQHVKNMNSKNKMLRKKGRE